ncbi:MAG: hypothetical protein HOW97_10015 [Catenulispora sp.]|nr:hypothetical protein [Catenulispora sp.]
MPTHRLVLSRLRRELPTMTAVVALIVITTTLLAVLARFVSATGDSATRQALDTWTAAGQTTVRLDTRPAPEHRAAALEALRQDAAVLPHATIDTGQVSVSYALPGKTATGDPPLMTFEALDGLEREGELLAGAWPAAGGTTGPAVQVAVPKAAADELHLSVGGTVTVTSRITQKPIAAQIVGIYRPRDARDRFWQLDPLGGAGVDHPRRESSGFVTYGPFAMDAAAFDRASAPVELATLRARLVPGTAGVGQAGLQHFADALNSIVGILKNDTRLGTAIQASVGAPTQVTALRHSLAVVASSALIPTVLLAVLALCALVMSASLLAEYRALTTALMRARGVGAPTIGLQALLEALLFTVPAAVLAPFIAQAVVPHLFSGTASSGSGTATWTAALASAGVCTAALVCTALRGATGRGTYADAQRGRSRRSRGVALRRAVLELGFTALGLLGYSQLRRYGAAGDQGSDTGINLILVTAPAFALAAAGLISVRIVPLIGRLAQTAARRGRRFSFELGAWRAGRGGRIGTPALLLVVGVAMAVLSTSYSASWRRAQADQGTFSVGSDVRSSGYTQPEILVAGIGDRLPAGDTAMLASRDVVAVGASSASVTMLAVTPDKLAATMDLRADLYPGGAAKLAADLAGEQRPAMVPLPGRPSAVVLKVRAGVHVDQAGDTANSTSTASLTLSLAGRLGGAADVQATLPLDGREHDLTVPLAFAGPEDPRGAPAWPLSLRSLTVDFAGFAGGGIDPVHNSQIWYSDQLTFDVDVQSVRPVAADGTVGAPLPPPAATAWTTRSSAGDFDAPAHTTSGPEDFLHTSTSRHAEGPFAQRLAVGYGPTPATTTPAQLEQQPPVPVVASAAYLKATGQHVGDSVKIRLPSGTVTAKVVGVIADLPTVAHGTPALLVDFERWSRQTELNTGHPLPTSTLQWWVRTPPGGSTAATAAALRDAEAPAAVTIAADTVRTLTGDPAQKGVRAAYLLAAVAAGAFALIDFLVHLIGALRERTTQNALVRALGATRRQVGVATSVELAFLVGVGVAAGCAIGELLAHLLIPAVLVTGDGSPAAPAVQVSDPWVRMAELAGVSAGALALGVAAVLLSSRRAAVGSMLRLGED